MKEILKPAKEGLLVRDPITFRPLESRGEEKEYSSYWDRRVQQGDVVKVDAIDESAEPAEFEGKQSKQSSSFLGGVFSK